MSPEQGLIEGVLAGDWAWTLICADNREVLPGMSDKSVHHVCTDPPYLLDFGNCVTAGRRGHFAAGGTIKSREVGYEPFSADDVAVIGPHLGRLPVRWCIVWHDAESGHTWRAALGQKHVRTGAWVRSNPCPQFTGDRPGTGFELAIQHGPSKLRWNGGGHAAVWTHAQRHGTTAEGGNEHPTPKPLDLMLALVADFTDPGDIVLDPFAGSGTTGVACLRLGRRFIGIEKDEKFAAVARERLEAEASGVGSLKAYRAGQMPLFGSAP